MKFDLAKIIQLNKRKYEITESTFYDYNRKVFPYKGKISFVFCFDFMILQNFVALKLPRKIYLSLRYYYRCGYSIKVTLYQLDVPILANWIFFKQLILYISRFFVILHF